MQSDCRLSIEAQRSHSAKDSDKCWDNPDSDQINQGERHQTRVIHYASLLDILIIIIMIITIIMTMMTIVNIINLHYYYSFKIQFPYFWFCVFFKQLGLYVTIEGQWLQVYASPLLRSRVRGLCGDADGEQWNEFRDAQTDQVFTTLQEFTRSWQKTC